VKGVQKYEMLSRTCRDFVVYASKTYGRIIISKKYLPNDKKTIKEFHAGGTAGGIKYLVQGILFKFVMDTKMYPKRPEINKWLYGKDIRNDHAAAKAAEHDLKGLISLFVCGNSRIK
jgi:hypothetical protein